ncbi:MAG: hypothetical protein ACPGEG_03855 [Salibacteraceae bacterium]
MKKYLVITLQLFIITFCSAQSYTINHFQTSFDTLTDYNSLNQELIGKGEDPIVWINTFDFGFDFLFFDKVYREVNMEYDGSGTFKGSPNYNLFLFQANYTVGTMPKSENRYKSDTINGLKVLKLEYRNMYFDDEWSINGENHFINFQTWFYEDGTIEVHFGDIDLSKCSYYFPGQGFSIDNSDPVGNIIGPWVSINTNDFSKGACFWGDHNNPHKIHNNEDSCWVLTSIPPPGFVVQFVRSPTSIKEAEKVEVKNFKVIKNNGFITIQDNFNCFQSCSIYDVTGRKTDQKTETQFLLNEKSQNLLILKIEGSCGTEIHKLIAD